MTIRKETTDGSEQKKARIDDETSFWLNKTKSGRGVIIVIDDQAFISSLDNIRKFVAGEYKGVKFSLLRAAED